MPDHRPFAVITGASKGIGRELARVFARNGYDLLITAGSEQIEEAGRELGALGTKVQTVQSDLAGYEAVAKLWQAVESTGRPVDAIAINAGVGVGGRFLETDLEEEINLIQLNVASSVHLAKLVVRQMAGRGAGRILFTSSVAGTMAAPLEAVYGASKAFILSFAKSLRYELKDTGITVTALQPGFTGTHFFYRAGMDDIEVGSESKISHDPAQVAEQGFQALMDGKEHVYAAPIRTESQPELRKFVPESSKAKTREKQSQTKKKAS
jgi:short-subunit dehydrogenase